ncbi:hypothetical protein [Erythrobacter aureus]|uniref:Nudix hydrolase domain-containing protein n=1 Tax=Erythrobacter aureus TaxID=2182384 RepID=A0A345YJ79_9SPHN|nr:hypothetical protein [Erythrobacter aureus]AXK43981.1 hypothetical protein DVR09_16130 [Erythrobacter aureus]
MSKIAHIIALRSAPIAMSIGLGFGIRPFDEAADAAVFDNHNVWVGPRGHLDKKGEEDTDFVQPIPYIVVRDGDKLLSYIRGSDGGESRLHNNSSVGIGGHVDAMDAIYNKDGMIDLRKTLSVSAIREICEELGIDLPDDVLEQHPDLLEWTSLIQSQAKPVDSVHIGLVCEIDLKILRSFAPEFNFETAIANAEYLTPAELIERDARQGDERVEMETWTGLVVNQMLQPEPA